MFILYLNPHIFAFIIFPHKNQELYIQWGIKLIFIHVDGIFYCEWQTKVVSLRAHSKSIICSPVLEWNMEKVGCCETPYGGGDLFHMLHNGSVIQIPIPLYTLTFLEWNFFWIFFPVQIDKKHIFMSDDCISVIIFDYYFAWSIAYLVVLVTWITSLMLMVLLKISVVLHWYLTQNGPFCEWHMVWHSFSKL